MAIVGWRKTSGVHQGSGVETAKDKGMADILVDESQFCLVGLNKSGPVSVQMHSNGMQISVVFLLFCISHYIKTRFKPKSCVITVLFTIILVSVVLKRTVRDNG